MKPLKTYIDYLLMTRHYASVPGWGAYMLTEKASTAVRGITAPRWEVVFSDMNRKDDGILASLIMEMEAVDYEQALRYIYAESGKLDRSDRMLGATGSLYGMNDLAIKPWNEIPQTLTLTLPGNWIRRVAMIAMFIVAFFMGSNTTMQNEQENYAAIMDTRMFGWICSEPSVCVESVDGNSEVSEDANELAAPAVADAEVIAEPVVAEPEYLSGHNYFLIVSSLANREDAEKQIQILAKRGLNDLRILERDGKFRLYIQTTPDFELAKEMMKQLRQYPELSDVWINPANVDPKECILPLNTPLLTNKKNKYNDNQLSMELSHLNKRAGGDQG